MHADWFQAAHPTPAIVLRRKLRPYCLGHELLLQTQGALNPQTLEQLSVAALICSLTYEQGVQLVQGGFATRNFSIFLWIWKKLIGKRFDLDTELATFRDYRTFALWAPELENDKGGRPCASPIVLRMLSQLISRYGWSESHAMNYPLSRATALLAAGLEAEGAIKLFDQEGADEVLAAMEEQEKKGWPDSNC